MVTFPFLCQKHGGFYSYIHCKYLVKLLKEKLTKCWISPITGSSWSFKLSDLSTLNQEIHQVQFRFSYPGTGACSFCSQVLGLLSCDSLNFPSCLSNFWVSGLTCDLTSLMNLKGVVNFSVCQAFCLLFRWSSDL